MLGLVLVGQIKISFKITTFHLVFLALIPTTGCANSFFDPPFLGTLIRQVIIMQYFIDFSTSLFQLTRVRFVQSV